MTKKTVVTIHSCRVNGRKKTQALESSFFIGTITTKPDSTYGCVKSTTFVRLAVIEISPTTTSKTCINGKYYIWKYHKMQG
ncbi:hypothetical protein HanXRQr2_Chr01g0037711 [Helianthus annuus]|uniref:Uncharacterized protein n=1 Tax=Helianthus annuus TaxID=4232 RepID=A0A9K3JZ93_HELAN|nr:hypothetical protein HanXRQr2_Chr01g0037711 [Helianthus annuus]KAJ0958186.1 hypothetical protein HanPSC8_Chr01g0036201 [Helianthus annuus]